MTIEAKQRAKAKAYRDYIDLGFSVDFWETKLCEVNTIEEREEVEAKLKSLKKERKAAFAKYRRYA